MVQQQEEEQRDDVVTVEGVWRGKMIDQVNSAHWIAALKLTQTEESARRSIFVNEEQDRAAARTIMLAHEATEHFWRLSINAKGKDRSGQATYESDASPVSTELIAKALCRMEDHRRREVMEAEVGARAQLSRALVFVSQASTAMKDSVPFKRDFDGFQPQPPSQARLCVVKVQLFERKSMFESQLVSRRAIEEDETIGRKPLVYHYKENMQRLLRLPTSQTV